MGLMQRLSMVFRSKASSALDKAEDPRQTLDYSYEKQLELLRDVKRGVADVATSRKRVELQAEQLQQKAGKLEEQARQALAANREDLAREALRRREAIRPQLEALREQHAGLQAEQDKLANASQRLQMKVDAFRTRKETIKANYTAAEAQAKIGEAVSGISEEMGDVGLAVQRAEDKTMAMRSRAGALDELMASGALDDASTSSDPIEAELNRISAQSDVDAELMRLRGELSAGLAPKSLEAKGRTGGQDQDDLGSDRSDRGQQT